MADYESTLQTLVKRLKKLPLASRTLSAALAHFEDSADEASRLMAEKALLLSAWREGFPTARLHGGELVVGTFDADAVDPEHAQEIGPDGSKGRNAVTETSPVRIRAINSPADVASQGGRGSSGTTNDVRGLSNLRGIDPKGPDAPVLKGSARIAEGTSDYRGARPEKAPALPAPETSSGPIRFEEPKTFPADVTAQIRSFEGLDAMDLAKENTIKEEVNRLRRQAEDLGREAQALRAGETPGWESIWRSKTDEASKLMDKAKKMLAGQTA